MIGQTENNNFLMSDYGHHPTEISLNLEALKKKYFDKQIVTIFQPHQYSRTLELLEDFKNCFSDSDILIIPDIYESRDSEEDKAKINAEKLVEYVNHPNKIF
jgi:UDP-N-acetylmuramate--alanine ligase